MKAKPIKPYQNLSIDPGILSSLWCIPLSYFQWMELSRPEPDNVLTYEDCVKMGTPERLLKEIKQRMDEFKDMAYLLKQIIHN